MKVMFWLRMMAWVKRGAIALELIAKSQAIIAEGHNPKAKRTPKFAEVFTPSVEQRNEDWQRRRDAKMYGEEPPE